MSTIAGQAGVLGSTDGTGLAARFNWLRGIAIDNSSATSMLLIKML